MDAIRNFNGLQQFQTISRPGAFQGSAPADQNGAVAFGGMSLQVVLAQMAQSLDQLSLGWNSFNGSQPERPLPFFAQLLEGQNRQPANPIAVTQAYPSDNEDGGGVDQSPPIAVTMAYPSDNEDGGIDQPPVHTAKYPSDNEDGGGSIPPVNRDPRLIGPPVGGRITEKYPSDNDDGGPRLIGPPMGGRVTEKYPSDNEDGGVTPGNPGSPGRPGGIGGVSPGNPGRPGIQITMKFPSDQEDWRSA